jgi:uncharacterized repeat protein (TIGR02059 family)
LTDPATQLPDNTVDEVWITPNSTYDGDAVFMGGARNVRGTVTGNAIFNGSSKNVDGGIVQGDAEFNNDSVMEDGTINGNATFNDNSRNAAMVQGNATFNDNSSNNGTIETNAIFHNTSFNDSGTINGDASFYDSSHEDFGVIGGDATFYGDDTNSNGSSVSGAKIRYYTADITTTRDFVSDGPWTVVADGAAVTVSVATYNELTTFDSSNGGSFIYFSFVGALIADNILTITYSHLLDETSIPDSNDYIVSVNATPVSVSGVSVSGDEVILTLFQGVAMTDTIDLDYIPGNNEIKDLLGNNAGAITNQNVTNITAAPVLVTARVNGTTILLTYDKALNENSVPSLEDFTIYVDSTPVVIDQIDVSEKK